MTQLMKFYAQMNVLSIKFIPPWVMDIMMSFEMDEKHIAVLMHSNFLPGIASLALRLVQF